MNTYLFLDREIHVSQFLSNQGKILLLCLVCPRTGDTAAVTWDEASPQLRQAALAWGIDPLCLLRDLREVCAEEVCVEAEKQAA